MQKKKNYKLNKKLTWQSQLQLWTTDNTWWMKKLRGKTILIEMSHQFCYLLDAEVWVESGGAWGTRKVVYVVSWVRSG